ncbi:hypothetical protein SCACP_34250 [Sporomusa carbonis]|uniref:glycosyltransferase n=1 Tax=Sporomusa carbonis TaxID=3076075 RepID=UPI003A73592D
MLSLCMIAKDEEKNLPRCLRSVAGVVDEIIVVDTGSTDRTVEIAREFGAKVYTFPWNDNFSDARNLSLEMASGNWILFLDADEELTPDSGIALKQAIEATDVDGYFVTIINYLGNEGWNDTCPDLVFRLFRNRPDYRFRGAIHEQIVDAILENNSQACCRRAENITLLHYGYLDRQIEEKDKKNRNLHIIEKELADNPQNHLLRYHYGVELYRVKRYQQAAEELIKAANGVDPQTIYYPKLLRYIVLAYYGAKMPEQALSIINTATRLFPDYADLYYYAGLIHFDCQEYGKAAAAYNKAVSLPEQPVYYAPFSGTRGFRSYFMLGKVAELYCNEEEALRFYIASLRDNPQFIAALERIIVILDPVKDPDYTRMAINKLCELETPQANLIMAQILYSQSAYGLALEFLERGLENQSPTPKISLCKAVCLIQNSRILEALKIIDSFAPDDTLYPVAKLNKLLCFWFEGNQRRVRTTADELFALGLSPDTSTIVTLLRESLVKKKSQPVTLEANGANLLTEILTRTLYLGKTEKAEKLLSGLSTESKNSYAATAGALYLRFGFAELAERYLKPLTLSQACGQIDTYELLADALKQQDRPLEAINCYRQCISLAPKNPRYVIKLIKLYDTLRQELLREASEKYPHVEVFRTMQNGVDLQPWMP